MPSHQPGFMPSFRICLVSLSLLASSGLAFACSPQETPEKSVGAAAEPAPPVSEPTTSAPGTVAAPMVEIPKAGQPLPGVLTGGQPTDDQLTELAEKGYRTIVNLRSEAEVAETAEPSKVEALGLRYVAIPMAGAADLTEENAASLDAVLADPASYPVLVHCASSNRVGGLLALRAYQLQGVEAEEALALGIDAGLTSLEPAVREALSLPPAQE